MDRILIVIAVSVAALFLIAVVYLTLGNSAAGLFLLALLLGALGFMWRRDISKIKRPRVIED